MKSKFIAGALCLLLSACSQKVYHKIYAKPSKPIQCLSLQSDNPLVRYYLSRYHFVKNCPFHLKTLSHFVTSCTSAVAKSIGSDTDGYLRFELYENKKLLFRNQIDFKGCLRQKDVDLLMRDLQGFIRYNQKK